MPVSVSVAVRRVAHIGTHIGIRSGSRSSHRSVIVTLAKALSDSKNAHVKLAFYDNINSIT